MAAKEKQQKKKKGRSTQELVGIKTFTKYGLETNKNELLFYLVAPTNISVLSHIRLFQIAAAQENHYAEYQLGKLYLYGQNLKQDYDLALRWLTASAEHGNQYAAQLLHSIKNNRNWFAAMGTLSLLHHISRMIQNRLEDERKGKSGAIIDRKLRRKIQEKNEALGIKQG